MNILLVNHYAGSLEHGMEFRPFYMAREWVRGGHHVTVLGASFSHGRTRNPLVKEIINQEDIQGVHYIWLKTPSYWGNGLRRAFNIFTFVTRFYACQKGLFRQNPPDVIIASSTYPLDMLPAYQLARKTSASLVYEVHDLWPLSLIEVGDMSRYHPFIMLLQLAENFAYKNADKVVSMLPKAYEHMIQHGMAAEKYFHIPNGVDVEGWQMYKKPIPLENRLLISAHKRSNQFMVCYAGAHGIVNALDSFIMAARLLRDYPVSFILVGQGTEKEKLKCLVSKYNLINVIFLSPVPRGSIPSLLDQMDALYIGLKREPLFQFGISPNKLMDYMMAGKPVIQAIDAGNDMVKENACGISVPAENPEAIAQAVKRLMDISPAERGAMGNRGKKYVLAHHDYRILAKQFLDIMNY